MNENDALNLSHLHAVHVIAETGSVSRAAVALFRAQSAVTRAVQETEAALNERLFDRKPSGMLPTGVCRAVLQRSARVFGELEDVARWTRARRGSRHTAAEQTLPAYLLNTRRLQLFVTLARHKHMPSAARALGITQPAVSSAIKILESGAGMPLFHRNPRGLLLTSEGETFLLHVRRALNELRHLSDDVAALRGHIQGSVTVGALPLGRTVILPEAIARVIERYPGVRVVTDESAYESLVGGLRAGDVDFILGALRPYDAQSGLQNEKLMTEELVVLARREHPLAAQRELTVKQLADMQWVLPRRQSPARGLFESMFKRAKIRPPTPTVETADLAVIRGLLLRTDMLAVTSAQQLHYERQSGEIVALDAPTRQTSRDIGLTLRAGGAPSPAARALIDAIRLSIGDVARTTRVVRR
ncbi:LysR family transcriptional regulator [Trinickia symbiotica]|uniref:LysR family transcriptional regulator n=1 Tax=Trinickia symbiotica TaxID=863227 RepID=A0A2N7X9X8_9BURK|nr:LysR family transcriptional regulator [Trinickia symbiotica]PMS38563.1 LysR family transcriptional regulator [Trinickia symbiotica]PPK46553.1 LysR family transcriptional regulator [Trinickia symbiotica]